MPKITTERLTLHTLQLADAELAAPRKCSSEKGNPPSAEVVQLVPRQATSAL
jgi:hypothetical protein